MPQAVHEMSTFESKNRASATVSSTEAAMPDRDALELAKAGKKQVLERRFGLVSMTGFSCSLMCTWEGVLLNFSLGLINGGPAGLIYSYLLAWLGSMSVFIAMGELSSMLPTAAGQYHWVNVLAPLQSRKFLSYVTGWATVISWVAAATVISFYVGTLIQTVVAVNITSYAPERWQGTLIMWGVLLLGTLFTTKFGKILPTLEVLLLLLHVLGFFGTLIPLVYHARNRGSGRAQEIFTTFFNLGGWNTQTLSFFIGISGNAASLLGTDGAIHMSEEVENSSKNVPWSVMASLLINGSTGFAILLAALFAVDDIPGLLESTSQYPFVDILTISFNSLGGATTIVCLIMFMNAAATVGALSSAGRMAWSFARDCGLPGWQWLRQVDRRSSIPFNAVFVSAAAACLLGLINVGSTTAFQDCVSLVLVGFYTSYLLAVSLLLYRRMNGDIAELDDNFMTTMDGETAGKGGKLYAWGPWRLKGWLGTANNIVAVIYLVIVLFFSFWPGSAQVTAETMNYSSLVLGVVMIGSIGWYFAGARKTYTGPVVEVEIAKETPVWPVRYSI